MDEHSPRESYDAESVAARALALFRGGYNCAEAVSTAVAEAFAPGQTCFPAAAGGFGGGIGRRGEVCGAVTGAVMALGLIRGRPAGDNEDEVRKAKDRTYESVNEIVGSFENRFGNIGCRELTGYDLSSSEGREKFRDEKIAQRLCEGFVTTSARALVEVLTK
ncbi:MAG: C-GCAxxG-C-C family protein [Candidatus Zixiibacteriota bacterium]|jgi:C_GCAxxG_C_C family probable redox protein